MSESTTEASFDRYEVPRRYAVEPPRWVSPQQADWIKSFLGGFSERKEEQVTDQATGAVTGMKIVPAKWSEKGLMFWGPTGTGKSECMGAIALKLKARGFPVAWLHWNTLIDLLVNDEHERSYVERVPCLFVDELAQHEAPQFVASRVASLIEIRYGRMLPLVAATNTTPPELAKALGVGTLSRIKGTCQQIKMLGADRRVAT